MLMLQKALRLLGGLTLLAVLAGCAAEEQAPAFSGLTEMPVLKEALPRAGLYEPLSPVMQDVYDRSIPEDVYSAD